MLFPKERLGSAEAIRHAYEGVINRCARLQAFAVAAPRDSFTEVQTRQELLAVDDMILLALYGRRLLTETTLITFARNVYVPLWKFRGNKRAAEFFRAAEEVSIWRLLNVAIHCEMLEVYRNEIQLIGYFSPSRNDIVDKLIEGPAVFAPKIGMKSDRSRTMIVDLDEALSTILERIVVSAVEAASQEGIYLELEYSRI